MCVGFCCGCDCGVLRCFWVVLVAVAFVFVVVAFVFAVVAFVDVVDAALLAPLVFDLDFWNVVVVAVVSCEGFAAIVVVVADDFVVAIMSVRQPFVLDACFFFFFFFFSSTSPLLWIVNCNTSRLTILA